MRHFNTHSPSSRARRSRGQILRQKSSDQRHQIVAVFHAGNVVHTTPGVLRLAGRHHECARWPLDRDRGIVSLGRQHHQQHHRRSRRNPQRSNSSYSTAAATTTAAASAALKLAHRRQFKIRPRDECVTKQSTYRLHYKPNRQCGISLGNSIFRPQAAPLYSAL
uniref:Uncharacterized protein n=1 Tax=Anopheles melas TaxID=34690 RepID=A0A182TMI4_9DIPT